MRTSRELPTHVVVLGAVGIFAVVALAAPAQWMSPGRYVGWATAVQAFGAVMAFSAAATAFAWQWSQANANESERLAQARASQAQLVSNWLVVVADTGEDGLLLTVRNGSEGPITKVVVGVVDGRYVGAVPELHLNQDMTALFDVVPPRSFARKRVMNPGGAMGWRPAALVAFTDAADRHWWRHSNGPLGELPTPLWETMDLGFNWSWTGVLGADTVEPI